MKFCLVLITFVSAISISKGNDIQTDFKNLNRHYLEMKNYSMDFTVDYFSAGQGTLMHQQGKVVRAGELHYVNLSGNITLMNNGECVAVNESAHLLVYNKIGVEKNEDVIASTDVMALIDSLWAKQEGLTYKYLEAAKGKRKVYIEDKGNVYYSAYSITMDASKFNLLELVYYVRPEANEEVNKIIIIYSNETAKPKTGLPQYKISYYVTRTSGTLHPTELFKNYECIDQTKIH